MTYEQEAPFSIQVELTKGCNLQCTFCGINGFQEKPNTVNQYMTIETATILAAQIANSGWNPRIEFAMHGEPTLNKNWLEIIGVFRKTLPKTQLMVTSNGGGVVKSKVIAKTVEAFFSAGGNILAFDEYQNVNLVPKIKAGIDEFNLEDMGVTVYQYPKQPDGNPHQRTNKNKLTFISPIDTNEDGTHADLNNHCGSGGKLVTDEKSRTSRCAKPFREISINWDGSVNLCCNDFIGEYHCGNILNNDISSVWNSDAFNAARKFLMVPDRSALRPCRGCDAKSYRVGLLPDKKGKVTLPAPTQTDHDTVQGALFGGPTRGPTKRAIENIIPTLTLEERENWPV